jgi:hypothetical protein
MIARKSNHSPSWWMNTTSILYFFFFSSSNFHPTSTSSEQWNYGLSGKNWFTRSLKISNRNWKQNDLIWCGYMILIFYIVCTVKQQTYSGEYAAPFLRWWATPRRRDLSQVWNYEFSPWELRSVITIKKNERHAYQQPRYSVCVTTTLSRFMWRIAVIYTSRWLYARSTTSKMNITTQNGKYNLW